MTDFDYEIRQKKNLTYGARHKKNGSKSRKCTLPHENMTKKEIAAMNGPIKTWNLNKPMDYDTYKTMPTTLQKEYIASLCERFNVSGTKLKGMLGVSHATSDRVLKEAGIYYDKSHRMSYKQVAEWERWLNGETETETESTEPECEEPKAVETPEEPTPTTKALSAALTSGKLKVSGTAEEVIQVLYTHFAGDKRPCKMTLLFNFEEDNGCEE